MSFNDSIVEETALKYIDERGYVAVSMPHLAPGELVVELDSPRRLKGPQFPSEIFHHIKK